MFLGRLLTTSNEGGFMNHRSLVFIAALGFAGAADATLINKDLLINGNAEIGDTSGWVSNGIEAYSTTLFSSTVGLPPGANIGDWVFSGGTGSAGSQSLTQSVDVSDLASLIDSGHITSSFSILLESRMDGGFTDLAIGKLRFLGNVGNMLLAKPFADTHIVEDVLDCCLLYTSRCV